MRDKLIELGVAFRASVDYSRIGLSRYLVLVDFHKKAFPQAERIFHILAKVAGLRYYTRLSISGLFVALFAPPTNQLENFKKLIHLLHQYEIIRIIDSVEIDYFKPLTPRLEYFDFDRGGWNINWKTITVNRVPMEEALLLGMLDINCYACILLGHRNPIQGWFL